MKTKCLFFATALLAHAAPSVHLPNEVHVPLESQNGVAVIDRATGQIRIMTIRSGTDVLLQAAKHSGLPEVTGATSGFEEDGREVLTASPANVIPLLPMPLDALRTLLRTGDLPSGYSGIPSMPGEVNDALLEMETSVQLLPQAFRPVETWLIEVKVATLPGDGYLFQRTDTLSPVRFFELDGDPLNLDQGLGFALGTRFEVTGYTDVIAAAPYDGMEVLEIAVISVPRSSDNDLNANLLGDDWEEFFFGTRGEVSPYDFHPNLGYTYLQLYLIGHDPRADCAELPDVPAVLPAVSNFEVVPLSGDRVGINFDFPADYADRFEFLVQQSEDLAVSQPYSTLSHTGPTSRGGDSWQIDLGTLQFVPDSNFFRLGVALSGAE